MKLSIEKLKELLPDATPDRRGKYLLATCPSCGHREFTVSTDEGHKCGCNRKKKCGWVGNIFTLAKKLGKFAVLNIEGDVGSVEKLENKLIKEHVVLDLNLPTIKMPLGFNRVYQDDYLDSRGFTEYERYIVGRTMIHPKLKKNYIVMAVVEGGEVKGYLGRHVWDKKKIEEENKKRELQGLPDILRYRNSETDFGKLLMGIDEVVEGVTKTVICVEGAFDKHNVDKLMGLHAQEEVKCNATFKCAISDEQMVKWAMKGVETLIMFYDPDVINQIKREAAKLQLYFNVLIAFNDNGDVDAGDIDAAGLSRVFSNLKSVSEFTSSKVVSKLIT